MYLHEVKIKHFHHANIYIVERWLMNLEGYISSHFSSSEAESLTSITKEAHIGSIM